MVGVSGNKFPAIRQHLDQNIGGVYKDMDTRSINFIMHVHFAESDRRCSFASYPAEDKVDAEAC
jgi:hypothetical protein